MTEPDNLFTAGASGGPVSSAAPPDRGELKYYAIALVIGALGGMVGAFFHLSLDWITATYTHLIDTLGGGGVAIVIALVLSAVMAVLAAWLVRTYAPETAGSGIQEIEGAMEGEREIRWFRALWVKFTGGLLALGSGMVLGREGPTIHLGAAVAKGVTAQTNLPKQDQRGLLAAGAAAGLAAAFNAPLAAIVFITEEMQRQFPFRRHTYIGLIVAAITSAVVAESLAGRRPLIEIPVSEMPFTVLPLMIILGALIGGLGVLFNHLLLRALNAVDQMPKAMWWVPALLIGGASGMLFVTFPDAVHGGELFVLQMSNVNMSVLALLLLCVLRFSGSVLSYSTGVPGGIFAPMLAIAASLGLAVGALGHDVVPIDNVEHACAIIAMGAFFTASVRAPVVAVILVMELTNAYALLLPLLVACVSASIAAQVLNGQPIYEMLLERTLRKARQA